MSTNFKFSLIIGLYLFSCTLAFAQIREYHLNIAESSINLTGKTVTKITVNGQFPAPKLEFEEGEEAVIHVHNHLKNKDSSIHWHGLLLPGLMDGVPGFNGFNGLKPKGHFVYRFKVRQSGTYWYHAHSKGQEQDGLYGALVIYPKGQKPLAEHEAVNRDYVVMLSDFHESESEQIMRNLKKSAEYYQNQRETIFDVFKQVQRNGLKSTWQDRSMWNQMRMLKTDLSDVTGYTFLINGKTPQQYWTADFEPNEKIRLRFINASAMSFFDVRIPHLKMTVVSADGQPVQPIRVDEFRIGTAETYDVIVEPKAGHYQIQAESIDRSGFALGRLQNKKHTIDAEINMPKSRARALLTIDDMGHGAHTNQHLLSMKVMYHADDQKMHEHSNHQTNHKIKDQVIGQSQHQNMQHDVQNHDTKQHIDQSKNHQYSSTLHATNTHSNDAAKNNDTVQGWANADTPKGHKALQYSDLQALHSQNHLRPAEREMVIRLGGTMERYIWTINGKKFSDAEPLQVKYGERIRLRFINESMMAHPMHLHGMFMQLENGQSSEKMPNKHTIIVASGTTVTALLTADELGEWAIHCHLLYHMTAGMMSKLIVANVADVKGKANQDIQSAQRTSNAKGEQHEHH